MTLDLINLIQQQGFRSISEVIGQYSWKKYHPSKT
jgi:hypothetical protein